MPVPRLFESATDPREQWTHVLASLLALTGPDTREALVAELAGEELPGAGTALVKERRPVPGGGVVDIAVHDGDRSWVLGIQTALAFDGLDASRLAAAAESLAGMAGRVIVLAVTSDRKPPAPVTSAPGDVRHESWLRVRDWVQERPERGRAQGVDLVLLREAEYVLTPFVTELYRLEELMPMLPEGLRETFGSVFFDLNGLSPAPRIDLSSGARVVFPRTGDPKVEVAVADGTLSVYVAQASDRHGLAGDGRPGWSRIEVGGPGDWAHARSWVAATARDLLPARR